MPSIGIKQHKGFIDRQPDVLDQAIQKIEAEKYALDLGLDDEMENYNRGLDKAISILKGMK